MRKWPLLLLVFFYACFSFKGVNIPTEMKSYYVANTEINARNAPAEVGQLFSEVLRKKIQTQTKLILDDENPDIVFTPVINRYEVNAVAQEEDNNVAFNRLTISINIDYENYLDETKNYKKSWSAFEDVEAGMDLNSLQFDLVDDIYDDIADLVFQDTFTSW